MLHRSGKMLHMTAQTCASKSQDDAVWLNNILNCSPIQQAYPGARRTTIYAILLLAYLNIWDLKHIPLVNKLLSFGAVTRN